MKNIEKYPNTKDALKAYDGLEPKNMPFDKWLESEYEEPREPTLLETAEELKNVLKRKDTVFSDVVVAFSSLTDAIEREKRKPVRNFDKYKTPKEASMYINDFLDSYADRIEAAWKREREAGEEAAQICGEIGEMVGRELSKNQSVTNCNRLGDEAKGEDDGEK